MKVLIYSNMYPSQSFPYSGIYVKNQYEALKNKECFDMELLAMPRKKGSFIIKLLNYFWLFVRTIPKVISGYDIVHIHFYSLHFYFAILFKLIRPSTQLLITFHGSDINQHSKGRAFKWLLRKAILLFNVKTILVGRSLCDNYKSLIALEGNFIVSAGVDKEIFFQQKREKKYDFIFVGSLTELKGVHLLKSYLEEAEVRELSFCFIGVGPYYNEILSLEGKHKIEVFNGLSQVEISRKLNESRFFISPSRTEGFPLSTLEALYCSIPVIATNIAPFLEQIIDLENGLIIEHRSVDGINSTINKALSLNSTQYEYLSENAKKSNEVHSLESVTIELLRIYRQLK